MLQFPYYTKIVGVSFDNEDGSSRQAYIKTLYPGEQLLLVDAATEEHPNAIAVYDSKDHQLGFLHDDLADDLRHHYPDFVTLACVAVSTGIAEGSGLYGAQIVLDDIAYDLPTINARARAAAAPPRVERPVYQESARQSGGGMGCFLPLAVGAILGLLIYHFATKSF